MITPNITIDAYHASSKLSTSKIRVFSEEGPEAFHRTFNLKTMPRPPKSNFDVGNGFECLLFEGPKAFMARYACKLPGMSFSTTEGKAWKKAMQESGLTILSQDGIPDLMAVFDDMVFAIRSNPFATKLLAQGKPQVTVWRELGGLGVTAQARPDWFSRLPCAGVTEEAYTVNLKTCADLDLYTRHCVPMGYHRQSALEQWLLAKEDIITEHFQLVVEKKLAPRCRVLRIPEKILSAGWDLTKSDIEKIAARYRSGDWSDVQTEIEDVAVPAWADRQLMAEVEAL